MVLRGTIGWLGILLGMGMFGAKLHVEVLVGAGSERDEAMTAPTTLGVQSSRSFRAKYSPERTNGHIKPASHRIRLLEEWESFDSYWSNNDNLQQYKKTGPWKQEVPFTRLPDFIKQHALRPKNHDSRDLILASHTSLDSDKLLRINTLAGTLINE